MRNALAHLAVLSAMATVDYVDRIDKPTPFNPNNIKPKTPPRPKNHKRYVLNGVEIWALSEKRAIDKYTKKYGASPIYFE